MDKTTETINEQAEVNTHLEHIEDLIFNEGVSGTRKAILFIRDIRDTLSGHSDSKGNTLTVKWDGAPAIFAGIDPRDGKFFVAKKSIFNKDPKVYKTKDEIKSDLSGDLQKKFIIALEEFSKLGITRGIYQGDLMFTKGDLKKESIDGQKHVTFHPNTIVYAVPVDTNLGKRIMRARIGVIWHTTYSGKDFTSLKAKFGENITNGLKDISSVWQDDATFKDASGIATFNKRETKELTNILSQAGKTFGRISGSLFKSISEDKEAVQKIKTYNNTHVRAGEPFPNPKQHVSGLYKYLDQWYDKQIEDKKSEKGKETWRQKKQNIMSTVFSKPDELQAMFELMNLLIQAKQMVINKLNEASDSRTFVRTRTGLRPTTPEGYVGIDRIGNAIKLVDRLEFSKANFSPDILKGWE